MVKIRNFKISRLKLYVLGLNCHIIPKKIEAMSLVVHYINNNNNEFQTYKHEDLNDVQCNICFEDLDMPYRSPCGHFFCSSCILKWTLTQYINFKKKKTCPVCRAYLEQDSNIFSFSYKFFLDKNSINPLEDLELQLLEAMKIYDSSTLDIFNDGIKFDMIIFQNKIVPKDIISNVLKAIEDT